MDLGTAPPSNAYLSGEELLSPETWYPLRVMVCRSCWLVQTEDYAHRAQLFSDKYAYFSSFSATWLAHAKRYVDEVVEQFASNRASLVIEIASNDGYLLQYVKGRGIPCLGVEPTGSTAKACREKGIEVVEDFFGVALAHRLAGQGRWADLMTANNVLAHVPDINDFVQGFVRLLKPNGVATFEFPHLLRLVQQCEFDTIYHEHFSYLSLTVVNRIFEHNGLQVFDVKEFETHGGSLRVFAQRSDTGCRPVTEAVDAILGTEARAGMSHERFYEDLQERAIKVKNDLLKFLVSARQNGQEVGAYGAAAKGNTLINYAGIRRDLVPWVVDRNPAKQGKYMPGSRLPIVGEDRLRAERPKYLWILPWNLRAELTEQLSYVREWGGQFVFAIPELEIV